MAISLGAYPIFRHTHLGKHHNFVGDIMGNGRQTVRKQYMIRVCPKMVICHQFLAIEWGKWWESSKRAPYFRQSHKAPGSPMYTEIHRNRLIDTNWLLAPLRRGRLLMSLNLLIVCVLVLLTPFSHDALNGREASKKVKECWKMKELGRLLSNSLSNVFTVNCGGGPNRHANLTNRRTGTASLETATPDWPEPGLILCGVDGCHKESSNALEPTAGSKGAVCFTGMSLDRSFDGPVGIPNLDIPFVPSIYHVCQWWYWSEQLKCTLF